MISIWMADYLDKKLYESLVFINAGLRVEVIYVTVSLMTMTLQKFNKKTKSWF